MSPVAALILSAIVLSAAFDLYLRRRQIGAVARARARTPEAFRAFVTRAEHERAADYAVANARFGAVAAAFDAAVAILWLTVLTAPLYALTARLAEPGLSRSVLFVLVFGAVNGLLGLPFAIIRTFGIEARFGFNRTTPRLFALDQIKAAALQLAFGAPLLFAFFLLVAALPRTWPLFGFAGAFLLVCALSVVIPLWIAPLFNAFRPLPESGLKARVEALLARCGFAAKGLFVIDASRRSNHGNAYFAGFGRAKRIVFFDTLLERCSEDEILSVLAHELGHYKLGHIMWRLVQTAVALAVLFAALGLAFGSDALARAFALPADPAVVLTIVMIAAAPVARLAAPLFNLLSRRAEFEADAFARDLLGAEPMASALIRLSRDNLSTLTPDWLYAAFYYSHPPVPERVTRLAST
ncbi:M48 family metallopeptidase [Methylocella sp.]|uniref:M48 family metallopeptidase n=1 Tax=Methylocella sp. TaxID=1978226 RepID=UPI0037837F52